MTPVVIMRTAVCMAVRRTRRMQSTSDLRSRTSSAASSPSRPTSASARFAPSSAARVRMASNSASGMRTKPSDRRGVIGFSSRRSADLAAPERPVIGGEVAVRDPEIPLQLSRIARGQRDHGLQPHDGGERDVGCRDFAKASRFSNPSRRRRPSSHRRRRRPSPRCSCRAAARGTACSPAGQWSAPARTPCPRPRRRS